MIGRILSAVGLGWLGYQIYLAARGEDTALDVITTESAYVGAWIMQTPTSQMTISAAGLAAIADLEGFSPTKYQDAGGYSIGFGHFIKAGESFPEPMSRETAFSLLQSDAKIAMDAVRGYVKVPLTQNQFDALVSFTYNVGVGAFKNSTLLRLLNAGDVAGAAAQFPRWNQSRGVVLSALTSRRAQERARFIA